MCYYKPYEEFCQGVNQNFSRKFLKHRMEQRQCVSLVKSHLGLILLNNLIIFIFDIMFVIYYLLYIYFIFMWSTWPETHKLIQIWWFLAKIEFHQILAFLAKFGPICVFLAKSEI